MTAYLLRQVSLDDDLSESITRRDFDWDADMRRMMNTIKVVQFTIWSYQHFKNFFFNSCIADSIGFFPCSFSVDYPSSKVSTSQAPPQGRPPVLIL